MKDTPYIMTRKEILQKCCFQNVDSDKNAKTRLEQKLTNVYTRNNNGTVTTKTDVVDYQTKHPYTLYSYTKTNVIPNTSVCISRTNIKLKNL